MSENAISSVRSKRRLSSSCSWFCRRTISVRLRAPRSVMAGCARTTAGLCCPGGALRQIGFAKGDDRPGCALDGAIHRRLPAVVGAELALHRVDAPGAMAAVAVDRVTAVEAGVL